MRAKPSESRGDNICGTRAVPVPQWLGEEVAQRLLCPPGVSLAGLASPRPSRTIIYATVTVTPYHHHATLSPPQLLKTTSHLHHTRCSFLPHHTSPSRPPPPQHTGSSFTIHHHHPLNTQGLPSLYITITPTTPSTYRVFLHHTSSPPPQHTRPPLTIHHLTTTTPSTHRQHHQSSALYSIYCQHIQAVQH